MAWGAHPPKPPFTVGLQPPSPSARVRRPPTPADSGRGGAGGSRGHGPPPYSASALPPAAPARASGQPRSHRRRTHRPPAADSGCAASGAKRRLVSSAALAPRGDLGCVRSPAFGGRAYAHCVRLSLFATCAELPRVPPPSPRTRTGALFPHMPEYRQCVPAVLRAPLVPRYAIAGEVSPAPSRPRLPPCDAPAFGRGRVLHGIRRRVFRRCVGGSFLARPRSASIRAYRGLTQCGASPLRALPLRSLRPLDFVKPYRQRSAGPLGGRHYGAASRVSNAGLPLYRSRGGCGEEALSFRREAGLSEGLRRLGRFFRGHVHTRPYGSLTHAGLYTLEGG